MPETSSDSSGAPSPVKVLYVVGTLDIGGAETQLVELASRLDRATFEPVVCSMKSGCVLADVLRQRGVRVVELGFGPIRHRNPIRVAGAVGRTVASMTRLWRTIRAERPHVVHGVLISAYVVSTIIGRLAGVRSIVSSRRSLGKFKERKHLHLLLERLSNTMTDLFIANSDAVRRDTLMRENIRPEDIVVIYNGIDLRAFDSVEPAVGLLEGSPRVLVVANLIHYKGHEFFLRAWQRVVSQHPDAVAYFAGEGPMRPDLESLAAALGLHRHVRFLGSRRDVPALLKSCDLYVHPSTEEGYSNAVLEAMAAARPIVATAVGGNVEAIADGDTGLLVPPGDVDRLTAAMLRFLADRDPATLMGARARQVVERRFDVGAMVSAYERTYLELLGAESPEPAVRRA